MAAIDSALMGAGELIMRDAETSTGLIDQNVILESAVLWHRDVIADISERLQDPDFPCLFSKNAFQKGLLRFIFVESVDPRGMRGLAKGLAQYVELSRDWSGSLNTAYPLVIAFSRNVVGAGSVSDYDAFGWRILQALHELDPAPWPARVGTDPDAPGWSMCFSGMQLFCNMSHPAHVARRSRNLGRHFVMIVNPRERFDVVAGDTPAGRKVRKNIRSRIAYYDGMEHCPQLAAYGDGALEWWQYSVSDENKVRSDRCPFRFNLQAPSATDLKTLPAGSGAVQSTGEPRAAF